MLNSGRRRFRLPPARPFLSATWSTWWQRKATSARERQHGEVNGNSRSVSNSVILRPFMRTGGSMSPCSRIRRKARRTRGSRGKGCVLHHQTRRTAGVIQHAELDGRCFGTPVPTTASSTCRRQSTCIAGARRATPRLPAESLVEQPPAPARPSRSKSFLPKSRCARAERVIPRPQARRERLCCRRGR